MKRRAKNNAKTSIVTKSERYDNSKFWIEYGIDLEKRKVMLSEDVEEESISYIVRGIHKMVEMDYSTPIDVYVSTFGGSVYEKLALYDTLRSLHYLQVRTHAFGKVMSAGIAIYLAGDERHSLPNTTFMAHAVSSETEGKLFEMETSVEECKRLTSVFLDIYAERTNWTKKQWQSKLRYKDFYFGTDKAKELGIVTH